MARLERGAKAPDIELDTTEGPKRLADYRGEWLVLYFYPKNFTSGCTTEACDFRDRLPGMNAKVLGVSPDGLASHREFGEEYGLPFPLAADEDHALAEAFGAWGEKTKDGKRYQGVIRSTFIIDPHGKVAEPIYDVRADGHAERVGARLAELQG